MNDVFDMQDGQRTFASPTTKVLYKKYIYKERAIFILVIYRTATRIHKNNDAIQLYQYQCQENRKYQQCKCTLLGINMCQ